MTLLFWLAQHLGEHIHVPGPAFGDILAELDKIDGVLPGCLLRVEGLEAEKGLAKIKVDYSELFDADNLDKLGHLGVANFFVKCGLRGHGEVSTLLWSKLGIFGVISTVGLTMFPFILPSSIDPRSSLTVWDASSSHLTLFVMLVVTVIFMPIILLYTAWVYKVLWGKVTLEEMQQSLKFGYILLQFHLNLY